MANGRRTGNKPWKHIYGVDRKYTARVDRLRERQSWPSISAMSAEQFAEYAERSGIKDQLIRTVKEPA